MTPRQTCPQPSGFGRNLRSKTRWFTGFCNSHQVSHFATFFIDARAEISVAESHFSYSSNTAAQYPQSLGGIEGMHLTFSLAHSVPDLLFTLAHKDFLVHRAPHSPWPLSVMRRKQVPSPHSYATCSLVVLLVQVSTMILPQVHLRKPCYDFSFL